MKHILLIIALLVASNVVAGTNYVWRFDDAGKFNGTYHEDSAKPYPLTAGKSFVYVTAERYANDPKCATATAEEIANGYIAPISEVTSKAKESAQAVSVTRTLVRLFPELAGREAEIIQIFSEELERAIKEGRQ